MICCVDLRFNLKCSLNVVVIDGIVIIGFGFGFVIIFGFCVNKS